MKQTKSFFAVKVPGGFIRSICDRSGVIEVTKDHTQAEWNNENVARALSRYAVSQFPNHKRFEVYSFKAA